MIFRHAPVTASEADLTYIGCTCRRFEAQASCPEDRPRVWVAHAKSAGVSVVAAAAALRCSSMVTETFAPVGVAR
jgi:hypothetical protein